MPTRTPHRVRTPELAERLGLTERQIRDLRYRREIPYYRIGRTVVYDVDEVEAWFTKFAVKAPS